jgi:hypothetical protein
VGKKHVNNSFADEEGEVINNLCSIPIGESEGFFMKKMIQSGLFSVGLHGILLAGCLAMPAQKLIPLFQAGNSSLTLTALSFSAPDKESSQTYQQPADRKPELKIEPDIRDELTDEPEVGYADEDNPDDFPAIPDKKHSATVPPKPQNQKTPIDADARVKGVQADKCLIARWLNQAVIRRWTTRRLKR